MGSGPTNSVTPQRYNGIQIGSSQYGGAVPLLYGRQRMPFTLVWYGSFKSTPSNSGGGKGGGGSPQGYQYSASFAAALCEGPINGITTVWLDKDLTTLAAQGLTAFSGGTPCTFSSAPSSGATGGTITSFPLAAANWGITFSDGEFRLASITGGGVATWSPGLANSVSASAVLGGQATWTYLSTNFSSQAIPYDHIAYVGAQNKSLGDSAQMPNLTFEVDGFLGYNIGGGIVDADPSQIVVDYLTDPNHGLGLPASYVANLSGNNNYQGYVQSLALLLSPCESTQRQPSDFLREVLQATNSDAVWSGGQLKVLPYCDGSVSGNSFSYAANLTPIYSFTDDDFIQDSSDPPVKLTRKPLSETFNHVKVEYLDRTNSYQTSIAEATDLGDIAVNGERVMDTVSLHGICVLATARTAAQLLLQASLYERNTYTFRVRADYWLLEPMDYIAITDSGLGLAGQVCRITKVTDDDLDVIEIEAMEVPGTVRTTPQYNWQAVQGYNANFAVSPGSVQAPVFIEAASTLVAADGGRELWIGVCGPSGSASWGGCQVYMSFDGTTYNLIGTVSSPAKYGALNGSITAVADPDTTTTMGVTLNNTLSVLDSGTVADADNDRILVAVGSGATLEFMSYETATLVTAGQYNITYLRRGQFGTTSQAHSSSAQFVRLDGSMLALPLDPGWIGQTLHFKFCSFNLYGRAFEQISGVTDYTYTPSTSAAAYNTGGQGTWVATGSAVIYSPTSIIKPTTGANAWDSAVYSKVGFVACQATARVQTPWQTALGMLGLSTTPTASSSYTNANFALYTGNDGAGHALLQIYESGTHIADFGTYVVGDQIAITYDGANVRYFHNGALLHTTPAVGLTLYLFIPCSTPGGIYIDVTFNQITAQQNNASWVTRGTNGVAIAGNQLQANNNTTGWGVVDAYTQQSYGNGATFSFRGAVCQNLAAGLTTALSGGTPYNPSAGGGSTYQFLWFPNNAGGVQRAIIEVINGTATTYGLVSTAILATDVMSVEYDGFYVRYYFNGVLVRTSPPVPGLTLSGYFTSHNALDIAADVYFASVPQATPWAWEQTGTCTINDDNACKPTGSAAWDSGGFTMTGFSSAYIQGKATNVLDTWMLGLTTTPSASVSYTNINYAWYNAAGTWEIYESGTLVGGSRGTVAISDFVGITYNANASTITYWLNGTAIRTVSVSGLTLYGQVAINNVDGPGGINSLKFGAGCILPLQDTSQIAPNAVCDIVSTTVSGPTNVWNTTGTTSVTVATITIGPYPFATTVILTVQGYVDLEVVSGQASAFSSIGSFNFGGGSMGTGDGLMARNPSTALPTDAHSFSYEKSLSLAANTTQTYYFTSWAGGISAPGSSCNISNAVFKGEAIKR